jgi:protoheme ferro-lyase
MSFKQLLAFWRTTCPDVDRMGKVFDDSGREMVITIDAFRWLSRYLEPGECKIDLKEVRRSNEEKVAKFFSKKVHQLLPDKRITRRDIEEMLISANMKAMPSWDVPLSLYIEYLKDNMRSEKREVLESDIRDIIHFRCLPYVDYFVTDRYFTEIARRIKGQYQATVLRNVGQLVKALSG